MKLHTAQWTSGRGQRAFTLLELMIASSVGLVISGVVMALLLLAVTEDRLGLGCATVEEQSYVLQAKLTKALRMMSANQGMSPDYALPYTGANGTVIGYQGAYLFESLSNGTYATEHIFFNQTNGTVTLFDSSTTPASQTVWSTNTPSCVVSNVWFNTSLNPDGSINSSLVNVVLELSDNGFAAQNPTNDCASIYRSFSVQLRGN